MPYTKRIDVKNGFFIRRIYVCIQFDTKPICAKMCAGMRIIMKKSRLIIMDIIIVILVVLNAAMIIAVAENYNDENRTYNTRWFMNLYKNDEYGRAVDYASRDKIVIDNIQDNELDESIAVAEYYNAGNFMKKCI